MIPQARCNLVLALARVLLVNGQATEQTVAAAERLGRALGLRARVLPRWGEVQLQLEDDNVNRVSQISADPTGVDMYRVAAAMLAVEDVEAGRLAPGSVATTIAAV